MFLLKKDWEERCYHVGSRWTSFAIKVFNEPSCYRGLHWFHNPPLPQHLGFRTPLLVAIDIILVSEHFCLMLLLPSWPARARLQGASGTHFAHGGEDQCLEEILQNPLAQAGETKNYGSLPMELGGIGLRSATRTSAPAYWASWNDSLRHPIVAWQLVDQLKGHPETPFKRQQQKRDGSWSESWGSNHHSGRQCRMEPGHLSGNQRMSKKEQCVADDSMKLAPEWRGISGRSSSNTCTSEGSR